MEVTKQSLLMLKGPPLPSFELQLECVSLLILVPKYECQVLLTVKEIG